MKPEEMYNKVGLSFKKTRYDYEKITSMTVEKEVGEFLYHFVRMTKPNVVIETGSGLSTLLMASAMEENQKGHIYTFDIIDQDGRRDLAIKGGLDNFISYTLGSLRDKQSILQGRFDLVDMIHLDADHKYEAVMEELAILKPWFHPGLYLCFHDSTHEKFINHVGRAITDTFASIQHQRVDIKTEFGLTIVKVL